MKRLNDKTLREEIICDNPDHKTDTIAHGQITIHFWYGSKNDLKQGALHVCDECAENAMYLLRKEFSLKKDFLKPIEEM